MRIGTWGTLLLCLHGGLVLAQTPPAGLKLDYTVIAPASNLPAVGSQSVKGVPPAGVPSAPASATPVSGISDATGTIAPATVLGDDYRIASNDLIDVEVYGVPDLRRTVRVNASGTVNLPLIGQVTLLGMTAQQAEEFIARKYAEKYLQNPEVSLFIREYTMRRITIEGAVGRPGIYPVAGQMTLLRVIALAGGGASMAALDSTRIYRVGKSGERQTLEFDVEKVRSGEIPDPEVLPDDVVVVPRNGARAGLRDSLFRDIIDSINPFSVLAPK